MRNLLFLTVISFLFISCTSKAPITNRSQMILISKSEELSLGEKSYKQTLSQSKVITNTKDAKRVKEIGLRIAKTLDIDYQWEFNLIENKQKNAFCLPGGKVVVYTGILEIAQNDDQLATVMSHEIAHALARHGAERMSNAMISSGIQSIGNILLSSHPSTQAYSKSFNLAYGIGSQYGILMPYERMQESEADEIGIHLMYNSGYDVNEAIKFWNKMNQNTGETIEFLSTHPSSKTRIKNIKKVINTINKQNIK